MFSSKVNTWSTKTQSPNGLKVTLVKKRNFQVDQSAGVKTLAGSPAAKCGAVPRWAVESNKNPCKLVIKRRKTAEYSAGSLETSVSGEPSLKVRIVASTKVRRGGDSSLTRVKNWCKEQIATALPLTCFDNFVGSDATLQPSPKCVVSDASLSAELFHLQPSPKDSGIDVSSPPRRLDEIHINDVGGVSAPGTLAPEISIASSNIKKSCRTRHLGKALIGKCREPGQNGTAVAGATSEKSAFLSESPTTQVVQKRPLDFKPAASASPRVEEGRSRLLLRLPTSAFQPALSALSGLAKERGVRRQTRQSDGGRLMITNLVDSDQSAKCHFVQSGGNAPNPVENHGSENSPKAGVTCTYSISLPEFEAKTNKRMNVKSVKDINCEVTENLTAKNDSLSPKESIVEEKNFHTTAIGNKLGEFDPETTSEKIKESKSRMKQRCHGNTIISDDSFSLSASKQKASHKKRIKIASKSDNLTAKNDSLSPKEIIVEEKNSHDEAMGNKLGEFDPETTSEKITIISDDSFSLSASKQKASHKKKIKIASKSVNDAISECKISTVKQNCQLNTSTGADSEKVYTNPVSGTTRTKRYVRNQRNSSVISDSLTDGCDKTPEGNNSDAGDKTSAQTGIRINLKSRNSTPRVVDHDFEVAPGSLVQLNEGSVAEKTAGVTPGSANYSTRCSDLDRSSAGNETPSLKLGFKLTSGRKRSGRNQECLTVEVTNQVAEEPLIGVRALEAGCITEPGSGNTAAISASSSVSSRSKRLTRSSMNKQLNISNTGTSITPRNFDDHICPSDESRIDPKNRSNVDDICGSREQLLCFNLTDCEKTEKVFGITKSAEVQKDLLMETKKIEHTKVLPDVSVSKNTRKSSSSSHVKKRHAGSRNSASRRSFERLCSSKESRKMSVDEAISISTEDESKNDEYNQENVGFNFRSLGENVSTIKDTSSLSDCQEKNTNSSELRCFTPKMAPNCKDDLLSVTTIDIQDDSNCPSLSTYVSLSFAVEKSQEIPQLCSEVSCLQNSENSVDSEDLLRPDLSPFEPCHNSGKTRPDLNLESLTKPANNYMSEFAKFVTVQHFGGVDSSPLTEEFDLELPVLEPEEVNSSSVAENIDSRTRLSSFSFSPLDPFGVEPEYDRGRTKEFSVQSPPQIIDLISQEISSKTPCSASKSLVSSLGEKSSHNWSVRNFDDSAITDSSNGISWTDIDKFCGSHPEAKDSFSENISLDLAVSIDRELTSLQYKVAELLRIVFPRPSLVHPEQNPSALPQLLDQVLDAVLCASEVETGPEDCRCDCQVTLCRSPSNCLKQFRSKVLKLLKLLLPSSNLEDLGAAELELLVEAVTLANSAENDREHLGDDDCLCGI